MCKGSSGKIRGCYELQAVTKPRHLPRRAYSVARKPGDAMDHIGLRRATVMARPTAAANTLPCRVSFIGRTRNLVEESAAGRSPHASHFFSAR